MQYQKITFGNITTRRIRNFFRYWEAFKLTVTKTRFPKFTWYMKAQILSVSCFPGNDTVTLLSFLRKCSPNTQA